MEESSQTEQPRDEQKSAGKRVSSERTKGAQVPPPAENGNPEASMILGTPQLRAADAYRNYAQALQDAWSSDDAWRRAADMYRGFASAAEGIAGPDEPTSNPQQRLDAQQHIRNAYNSYAQALRDAWSPSDIQQRSQEAYSSFVRNLQQAWTDADAGSFNPAMVNAISQTMMAGAWLAAANDLALNQRWWTAASIG
jgi:hypothetical protein